ncbi:MAG: YciC family protein [Phenylobacterium sp.]|nr:YciC family protein [Phenylobacterium sp.]
MTDTTAAESRKLDIGRVIGGTFSAIGRNFATFAILGVVLVGIPTTILMIVQGPAVAAQTAAIESGTFNLGSSYFVNMGLAGIALLISAAVLQAALIHVVVQDSAGKPATVGEALATGLRAFLPLLLVSLLYGLLVGLGMVLLIVPGIMIAVALCVCVPAVVADRVGVFGSLKRSRDLTRGNRWRIFGLFVVLFLLLMVLGVIVATVVGVTALTNPAALQDPALSMNPIYIALNVLQQIISTVIGAALISVLYVELRKAKDGLGSRELADIFN